MLRDLFVNTTIILSFIFIGGQLLRDKPLKKSSLLAEMCSRYFYWNIKCTVDVLWRTYWGYYVRSTLFSCYFGNYNWRSDS